MKLDINKLQYTYFLGVGGIGMSALARWFKAIGKEVAGYDKTATPLTNKLEQEGITIHYEDTVDQIPQEVLSLPKEEVLVVYTPAIPKSHQEYNYLKEQGFVILKRAEVLGLISAAHFTVGVAGTHGKTTTSSMLAHILYHAGRNCTAFLGGIATNYESNLLLAPKAEEKQLVVVEADEFDRSFLHLHPAIEVITTAEADHLDIYGDENAVKDSFNAYINNMVEGGELYIHEGVELEQADTVKSFRYGMKEGEIQAKNIKIKEHKVVFDIALPQFEVPNVQLSVPGEHNVNNAIVAAAVAASVGLSAEEIAAGIATYKGVKRRFEYIVKEPTVYIDDYAHHPTEVKAFISSVKELYPNKKLTVIFQPHLFTRTRDFAEGFAQSLSLADKVLLMDIYPAREEPIEGVTAQLIYNQLTTEKCMVQEDTVIQVLEREESLEVIATIGAGNIDRLVTPLKRFLEQR
ncbi:UDP-N-acetylmuramate--L-alanine ligase [Algivirga pacifica]|uniref:UDP-N-acetylmuramate--L-alanine ligase n=1 Tax=Algivirga pacifica TaxID=1162670 RepID=A0ABP9CYI1_9BACT